MNLLPNVSGTIANWPMQGDLRDISGNGLDLMTVFWGTPGTAIVQGGQELYGTVDSCLRGFLFDGATKLVAPSSGLFRMTGAYTIQFVLNLASDLSGEQVFACCADPSRFGGFGGQANNGSSLYTWLIPSLEASPIGFITSPFYYDATFGASGKRYFPPAVDRFAPPTDWGITVAALYTCRHNVDGTLDMFYNATKRPAGLPFTTAGANASNGTERFWIGGCDSTFADAILINGLMCGYRVVNYARSDAQVAADANYVMSAVCGLTAQYPVTDASGGTDDGDNNPTTGNIVYDGLAAAQFATALRQGPRK